MLGLVSDRVGVVQVSPLVSEDVCWEPTPLFSLHTSKNSSIQISYWVLHKAKEVQHCMGILCDGFEDQVIALLAAIKAG